MLRRAVHFSFFVLVPAALAAVSLQLQPIKDWVFEPTYIRWAVEKDDRERTQTFIVHNSGQHTADLCISYGATPRMAISDFFASSFSEYGPGTSFTSTLTHLDSAKFREPQIRRLVDPHFNAPSLVALENELRSEPQRNTDKRLPGIHERWLQVCHDRECSKEESFELWEQPVNLFRNSAVSSWYSSTGWQVYFTEGYLSPAAEVNFVRQLQPQSTSYLRIQFAADKINMDPAVQSPGQPGTEVKAADVQASDMAIAWGYRRWQSLVLFVIIVVIVAIPILKPKPFEEKTTHELVNQALGLDGKDQETANKIWDLVYTQIQKDIVSSFEVQRTHAGKPAVLVTAVRLFDYIRTCLRIDYGKHDQEYRSKQDLDSYVGRCLEAFVDIL